MKKIIGYTRVSTREQVKGFSLAHQEKQIHVKVDMLGLTKRGIKYLAKKVFQQRTLIALKLKK